jgi:hypothetical protein
MARRRSGRADETRYNLNGVRARGACGPANTSGEADADARPPPAAARGERLSTRLGSRPLAGFDLVADHPRSFDPHAHVIDPAHFQGLWKRTPVENIVPISQPLAAIGRSLDDYAAVIEGAA